MENWESIQRNRQRAYEAHIQKETERYWRKSITDAAEHFKRHITEQIEKGIVEYSAALRQIASEVAQAGAQEIMPDEAVMISRLVRGLTRQLQQKYCPTLSIESRSDRVAELPPNQEVIPIQDDDSDPPTPEPLSAFFFSSKVKGEPTTSQRSPTEVSQGNNSVREGTREISHTVTPQRQLANMTRGHDKRPLDATELGLSHSTRNQSNKRARLGSSNWISETIDDEPTERGSIHCSEVEGQDYIFTHESFPGHFLVIRCDHDSHLSNIVYKFPKHPLLYSRAANHFKKENPREKCHAEDVKGEYNDIRLIEKFGYRGMTPESFDSLYGDDLEEEDWVARSNEKAAKSKEHNATPAASRRAKARGNPNKKGKGKTVDRTVNRAQPASESSSPTDTIAGPSSAARQTPRVPELGPATRRRASQITDPDALELWNSDNNATEAQSRGETITRNANVAPVADMGIDLPPSVRERRNTSRPASRTSSRLAARIADSMPDGLPMAPPLAGIENESTDFANDQVVGDFIRYLNE